MSSTNLDPSSGPQREEQRQPAPAEPAEVVDVEAEKLEGQIRALQQAGQRGANWFFWVAGLSVLNSLLIHSGAGIYFVVGMGLSLLADGLADHLAQQHPAQGVIFRAIAIGFTVLASGMVVLFGWLANKRYLSLFALGMVLYLLDGLIFLLFQDWLSIAFHGYALFCMWGGFMAYRQLNQIEKKLRQPEVRPADPGESLN
jgi:hypothetical protein